MLRQGERLDAVNRQLEQIHEPIASYFRGLAAQRFNLDHAQRLFEQAASRAPGDYQARTLLALGSLAEHRGDYKAAPDYYRHALELNRGDVYTAVETRRAIAIRVCKEGDHSAAIQILETLLPIASKHPYLNAQLLNHLAVEYQHAGRLHEALRIADSACNSPLATVYHEFEETRKEIKEEIRELEQRAVVVAAPQVQAQEKREEKQASASVLKEHIAAPLRPSRSEPSLSTVDSEPPVSPGLFLVTQSLIQSRIRHSIQPHAPPSPFRK